MAVIWTTTGASRQAGVKALIYGPSGVGKTRLSGTAPKPLIVSAESGTLSIAGNNHPEAKISSIKDLAEVFGWLQSSAASMIESVCLDSLTEIMEMVLSSIKPGYKDARQAYLELQETTMLWVRKFRDGLPGKHVFMTAKMEWVKDEATGICSYQPMMPGQKLGPALPYLFDEVFRLGVGKDTSGNKFRFLQTEADLQYVAKDRSGNLAPTEHPDLTFLVKKITGGPTQ